MGRRRIEPPEEDAQLDMSPMIDMVFLLLIFFVVNASAITVKKDQTVTMPEAVDALDIKSINGAIVINIYGDKKPAGFPEDCHWGSETSEALKDDQELTAYFEKRVEAYKQGKGKELPGEQPVLYIRGDQTVPFKHVRRAMNAAAKAGVPRILFATFPVKNKS